MDQVIRIKRSYTQGSIPQSLEEGELAVNVADKYIYVNNGSGSTIRLYDNATQDSDGLLSSMDKEKIDKIITTGNGNTFLSNSGEYKSIVSSLVLDYTSDLVNFSGTIEDNVIQNLQDAIVEKIPIFITVSGTIQYLAFATETDSEIILSVDSITSSSITSITATINLETKVISATSEVSEIYHPIILLNYTDDLKNGNLGESVTSEVSQKLLDAISGGWACVVKSGQSDILCNLQKIRDVVTIVMESIAKIGEEYFAATTIIGVNTSSNTITHSDSGGLYLVDKESVLYKNNTTEYTPSTDYNPATKKYVDDSIAENSIIFVVGSHLPGESQQGILGYPEGIDGYLSLRDISNGTKFSYVNFGEEIAPLILKYNTSGMTFYSWQYIDDKTTKLWVWTETSASAHNIKCDTYIIPNHTYTLLDVPLELPNAVGIGGTDITDGTVWNKLENILSNNIPTFINYDVGNVRIIPAKVKRIDTNQISISYSEESQELNLDEGTPENGHNPKQTFHYWIYTKTDENNYHVSYGHSDISIINNGDGTKFLSDDGTYKSVGNTKSLGTISFCDIINDLETNTQHQNVYMFLADSLTLNQSVNNIEDIYSFITQYGYSQGSKQYMLLITNIVGMIFGVSSLSNDILITYDITGKVINISFNVPTVYNLTFNQISHVTITNGVVTEIKNMGWGISQNDSKFTLSALEGTNMTYGDNQIYEFSLYKNGDGTKFLNDAGQYTSISESPFLLIKSGDPLYFKPESNLTTLQALTFPNVNTSYVQNMYNSNKVVIMDNEDDEGTFGDGIHRYTVFSHFIVDNSGTITFEWTYNNLLRKLFIEIDSPNKVTISEIDLANLSSYKKIEEVSALPSSPDANTLYLIPENTESGGNEDEEGSFG